MAASTGRTEAWYLERLEGLAARNDKVVRDRGHQLGPEAKARLDHNSERMRAAAELLRKMMDRRTSDGDVHVDEHETRLSG